MQIDVNSTQTIINDEIIKHLDHKSKVDLALFTQEIDFVKNLISPERLRAKDRPRDSKGRIIVDLENLHVLEDMSYFTERADFFRKHGKYTEIYPNPAPGSTYRRFWDEERRRCIDGYVRESDGEWIPGYYYFYLNYSPILKVKEMEGYDIDGNEGIRAERDLDFPDVWDGDYLYFHYVEKAESLGKHVALLKTRGSGLSFKYGSMNVRNYFMFKSSKSYAFASETEYLIRDGVLTKAWAIMNFVDNHTPFTQPRDYKDTDMHKKASYKDIRTKTERGFMSEIIGVTCKNDPDKGRGKRGKLLAFDETGSFPGLKKVWAVARKSVEQGRYVYGLMCSGGTGGEIGSDFEAAEAFMYSPEAYNILSLRNVFDTKAGETRSSLFIGGYLNRQGCYDKNGNSDVIKALVEIMYQRQKVRVASNDPNDLVQEKAETPITPQEAVLRVEGSIFPIQDLKETLAEIMPKLAEFTKGFYCGNLVLNVDGQVVWKMSDSAKYKIIRDFPLKDNKNKEGGIEIFQMPIKTGNQIAHRRYIAGVDPFDHDESQTNSLGSMFVLDTYTDSIVAEYTGRPNTANEFYENCLRLAKFYNALINYENNLKGMYVYFSQRNALHYLCDTPEILSEKSLISVKESFGNKKKGTSASNGVNQYARRLTSDWMVKNAYGEIDEETGLPNGLMNLHKIPSVGLIKEGIAWHPDINADRISAFGMLMILYEDVARFEYRKTQKEVRGRIHEDDFFKRHSVSYSYSN